MKPQLVYIDTNVFDYIYKQSCLIAPDLKRLRRAISRGNISIVLSIINLEETVSALELCPNIVEGEIRLILSLADWNKVIKDTGEILTEDIECYAKGKVPASPFISDKEVLSSIRTLCNWRQPNINDLLAVAQETRIHKENFIETMRELQTRTHRYYEKFRERLSPIEIKRMDDDLRTFNVYWQITSLKFVAILARHAGVLNACRKRGMEGLLRIRSVLMCTGAHLSMFYAQHIETPHRRPKSGDSRDLLHAITASAADVFVTRDKQFASTLRRIPIQGFDVMDIKEFFTRLKWLI